jgi:hypothetical protein
MEIANLVHTTHAHDINRIARLGYGHICLREENYVEK